MTGGSAGRCRVSVVVPVHDPGHRIEPTLASLDAQSLPPGEFEVILVDDGSTDATPARLVAYAAGRPHVRIATLPTASGWPSAPRNVGTDLAAGEYVLYLDHDDVLEPEALERLHAYAKECGSDVVVARETAVGRAALDADMFRANLPRARLIEDGLLGLLTVHRLFRTAFLRERGIRFRERVGLLEDHVFCLHAYLEAAVVSVLADYPAYRWVIHPDRSNRSEEPPELGGYLANITECLDLADRYRPAGPERDALYLRWLRDTVAVNLGPGLLKRPPDFQARWPVAAAGLLADRFPARLDGLLPPVHRARVTLLRAGDTAGLRALAAAEEGTTTRPELTGLEWADGRLAVRAATVLVGADGQPVRLVRDGDRLCRELPGGRQDVTADVAAGSVEVKLRHRESGVEWVLPGSSRVTVAERDGRPALVGSCAAVLDPATAAAGRPLGDGVWDLVLRMRVLGYDSRPRLACAPFPGAAALVSGRALVAYRTQGGALAVDAGHHVRTVIGTARPALGDAVLSPGGRLAVALPGVHAHGPTRLAGALLLDATPAAAGPALELAAELTAGDGRALLSAELGPALPPGRYLLRARFLGRATGALLGLDVERSGRRVLRSRDEPVVVAPPLSRPQPAQRQLPAWRPPAWRPLARLVRRPVR